MFDQIRQLLMKPRNKFRSIQQYLLVATPFEKFELVRNTTIFFAELLGVNVFSDCKRNWRTPIAGLCSLQFAGLLIFTAWYYWDENKITSIQPLAIVAIVIPVILYKHCVQSHQSKHILNHFFLSL